MSIASYRRNARLGVTGADTPTALPAAFEQTSRRHSLPPAVYKLWGRCARRAAFADKREANAQRRDMLDAVAWHLGEFSCSDIEVEKINKTEVLQEALNWYLEDGWRVVANIQLEDGDIHSVGLLPTRRCDKVRLVGTYIPHGLKSVVTVDRLNEYLLQPEPGRLTSHNQFMDANLIMLPSRPTPPVEAEIA